MDEEKVIAEAAGRESFRLACPEYFNFGYDVVDKWASETPDDSALFWVGPGDAERELSFAEVARRSNQVANALRDLGLQRGDQVLVVLPSVVEWWEAMIGLFKADLIAIPGTTLLTADDIRYRVEAAEVDAVITDAHGSEKMDSIAAACPRLQRKILVDGETRPGWISFAEIVDAASDDSPGIRTRSGGPALIYFTSGTTGMPKMVLHSHVSYGIGHELTGRYWLMLRPDDLHWNISDPGWAKTAYSGLFGPWIMGASIFVRHHPGKFDARDVLDHLERYPVTTLCAPPTVYRMLVQEDLSAFLPDELRRCMAAGEPLNPVVLEKWKEATELTIREGYGQTETVILCASLPGMEVKPGSMGKPPPGIELAIVDENGKPLPAGEKGEIAVRAEPDRPIGLFREYWRNPEATARCFRDGWYCTGDSGWFDGDGYFWFEARADDIITSAAYRIGPFEVENALMKHPAVAEVAVVGKPDPERTEIVKAFIVLADGYMASDELKGELQEHVKRATAPYKYPREIEFLEELPKTISDKIRRVELREREK